MRVFQTEGVVTPEGELLVRLNLPQGTAPGRHKLVVVLEEQPVPRQPAEPLNLPLLPVESWPENLSLRREDMYNDWGR